MISSSLQVFRFWGRSLARKLQCLKTQRVLSISALLFSCALSAFSGSVGESRVDAALQKLTLREKIAQLIQIRVPGKFLNNQSEDFLKIQDQVRQHRVGGVVLFAGNIYESAVLLNQLQRLSKLPLLVSADFERGASFRIEDTTSFPWTMALGAAGDERFAYQQGLVTARESRALGVHWIFAPVMDVSNNPDNPVINIRSFGEDPALVSRLGSAFIRGAREGGVLTTAKHFPGHGDTATDTHIGLAVVQSDMARLQTVELAPFRSAIEAGVDAIMTAHVAVPKVTGDQRTPATLSHRILTGLLRDSLNFEGLVVTDALEMGGITSAYWCGLAAVRAIQAGSDCVLLPPDAAVAINEIERAVRRGDIPVNRIHASARKILAAKSRLGLLLNRTVDLARIPAVIASPQNVKLAQEIADRSITVVKDEQQLLPVDPTLYPRVFSLALTPDLESSPVSIFQAEMRKRFPQARMLWANARISDELIGEIDKAISESDVIVCATLLRLVSGQNTFPLPPAQRILFDKLVASRKPLIWVSFGNPYVFRLIPQVGTYMCAFSYSDVSQIAAAKAISGEIEITGRMPVSIPGYAVAGEGRTIPRLDMTLKPAAPDAPIALESRMEKTTQLLDHFVRSGAFPGAVLLVGHQGKIVYHGFSGRVGSTAASPAVTSDTLYDLNSMSSAVGLAPALMLASEARKLILESPVADYVPEASGAAAGKTRLVDALKNPANADLLKTIVSRAVGMEQERFLAENLFTPLGMPNTLYYKPPRGFPGRVAISAPQTKAGLLSNAPDLAKFAQMLLNQGVYNHRRYLSPGTVKRFPEIHPWSRPSDSDWTGRAFSAAAFGHTAATGPSFWIDPIKKMFIILLANGNPDNPMIPEAQREIFESITAAIPD